MVNPIINSNCLLLDDLYYSYYGNTILVIGGGPSVTEDIKKIDKFDLAISANHHGCHITNCKYIVSMDETNQSSEMYMKDFLSSYHPKKISPRFWADYRITNIPRSSYFNSGTLAIYVACLMGGNPVIVIGIDGYKQGTYFHDLEADSPGSRVGFGYYERFYQYVRNMSRGFNVRPVSGPLTEYFKKYSRDEKIEDVEIPESLYPKNPVLVETKRNITMWQTLVPKGEKIFVTTEEYRVNPNAFRVIN